MFAFLSHYRWTCTPVVSIVVLIVLVPQQLKAAEPRGMALAIGLNKVNPAHYAGWDGELFACESDAKDMAALARSKGFSVTIVVTAEAKRMKVLSELQLAAESLVAGDIFMLSYSGHGGQVYDENGDEKSNGPDDVLDETWCLFDGQMIDDELYAVFRKFKSGVRILVFSDSCHSGTVAKFRFYDNISKSEEHGSKDLPLISRSAGGADFSLGQFFSEFRRNPDVGIGARAIPTWPPPFRAMPLDVARRTWVLNQEMYKKIGTNPELGRQELGSRGDEGEVAASGLLISGCQDNQLSKDGWLNGAFTAALKDVWSSAASSEIKNYRTFHAAIVRRFKNDPSQTPNFYPFGKYDSVYVDNQAPFFIK